MFLVWVCPLVRLTGHLAYVSTAKASPTPLPVLACESLYPNMWHQILNFFFPTISVVPMAFQYNFFLIGPVFLTGCPFSKKTLKTAFKKTQANFWQKNSRLWRQLWISRKNSTFFNKTSRILSKVL